MNESAHSYPPAPKTIPDGLARQTALEDAPAWALAVVDEVHQTRDELAVAMSEFSKATGEILQQQRQLMANQDMLGRSLDELRSEMRSRAGAHDGELDRLRREVSRQAGAIRDLEERLSALETDGR